MSNSENERARALLEGIERKLSAMEQRTERLMHRNSPEQLADITRGLIMANIAHPRRLILPHLAKLEPLEAMALVGELFDATLSRLPPDQRAEMLAAFIAALKKTAP